MINRAERHLIRYFGADARVIDLTRDRLVEYTNARRKMLIKTRGKLHAPANGSLNRELAMLRRGFAIMVRHGSCRSIMCPRCRFSRGAWFVSMKIAPTKRAIPVMKWTPL